LSVIEFLDWKERKELRVASTSRNGYVWTAVVDVKDVLGDAPSEWAGFAPISILEDVIMDYRTAG
jgi:hypothetical protein